MQGSMVLFSLEWEVSRSREIICVAGEKVGTEKTLLKLPQPFTSMSLSCFRADDCNELPFMENW